MKGFPLPLERERLELTLGGGFRQRLPCCDGTGVVALQVVEQAQTKASHSPLRSFWIDGCEAPVNLTSLIHSTVALHNATGSEECHRRDRVTRLPLSRCAHLPGCFGLSTLAQNQG